MTTMTVKEAQQCLKALLDEVAASHQPVEIKGTQHSAVLIAEEDWRSIQETLYLMSIPGMRESIIEGMETPLEECSE